MPHELLAGQTSGGASGVWLSFFGCLCGSGVFFNFNRFSVFLGGCVWEDLEWLLRGKSEQQIQRPQTLPGTTPPPKKRPFQTPQASQASAKNQKINQTLLRQPLTPKPHYISSKPSRNLARRHKQNHQKCVFTIERCLARDMIFSGHCLAG